MPTKLDLGEFPAGYDGRKTYVPVVGRTSLVASCYVYRGGDGRYHLHPDFGGTLDGAAARSTAIKMPYLVRDIGEYVSPIDGKAITTRAAHRDHLKRHDLVEVGNEKVGSLSKADAPKPRTREIGERIKRRLDEVKAMPQHQYNEQVKVLANG